jgi:colanic acid/amylovoran biosynthesis protein
MGRRAYLVSETVLALGYLWLTWRWFTVILPQAIMVSSTKRSPTILVLHFHSSRNAGDAALLEMAIEQLRSAFEQPRIIVSANYPEEAFLESLGVQVVPSYLALVGLTRAKPFFLQVPMMALGVFFAFIFALSVQFGRIIPRDWRMMLNAYRQADLVVGTPGNIFVTMGIIGWPVILSAISVATVYLFSKPFYVMPQSLGPIKRGWERYVLKQLYGRARRVFVREGVSFRLAHELGLQRAKVIQTPDLAFAYQPAPAQDAALDVLSHMGYDRQRGAVGVTAINRLLRSLEAGHFDPFYSALAKGLERMVDAYGTHLFFCSSHWSHAT